MSIDPVSGELEPEGLCEAGTKLRLHLDESTGISSVVGNERGGLEGARKRAARFKKIVNERVARNEEEKALLAWVYEDPVYGKSLEEWLWVGKLVLNKRKIFRTLLEDVLCAFEMHWAGGKSGGQEKVDGAGAKGEGEEQQVGEGGGEGRTGGERGEGKEKEGEGRVEVTPVEKLNLLTKQEALWGFSLAFLTLTLGAVGTLEMQRVMIASEVNVAKDTYYDFAVSRRLDISLNRRLSNLSVTLGTGSASKLVWLRHAWVDGDTFALTLLDPSFDTVQQRPMRFCDICTEEHLHAWVFLHPCAHNLCEPCWRQHWKASKDRQPSADVRCPFCNQSAEGESLSDVEAAAGRMPYLTDGGSLVYNYLGVIEEVCEALKWACQATDPKKRPPLPALPVKLDRGGGWEDGGDRQVVAGGWVEDEANNVDLIALGQFPEGTCHNRRPIPVHVDYVHENAAERAPTVCPVFVLPDRPILLSSVSERGVGRRP